MAKQVINSLHFAVIFVQDMLHDYNTPFQLAKIEEDDDDEEVDSPDDAELYDIEVRQSSAMSSDSVANGQRHP